MCFLKNGPMDFFKEGLKIISFMSVNEFKDDSARWNICKQSNPLREGCPIWCTATGTGYPKNTPLLETNQVVARAEIPAKSRKI